MSKSLRAKPIIDRPDDLLTNGTLRPSRKAIRGWDAAFDGCDMAVFRASPAGTVVAATGAGHVDLTQAIRAYPNRRYRLDIHVEPVKKQDGQDLVGAVEVRFASFNRDEEVRAYEPLPLRIGGDAPAIQRVVFQCPPGTGRLQVRLRFRVSQPIVVQRVRLVETGDYLLASHALANPPEPQHEMPPYLPASVILCDGRKDNRPLLGWLQQVFGERRVQRVWPRDLMVAIDRIGTKPDRPAVILDLPEDRVPALPDLLAWSDRTIVIASLATFAGAASRTGLEGIRIQDRICGLDLPCGKIVQVGYYTRGFALIDDIPYAWNDGQDDFAHRYLTMPKETKAELAKMNVRPAILTECGQGGADKKPLTLYRPSENGALLVMDPDGLEGPSAGEDGPQTFALLWLAALGQDTVTLGQYAAPPTHYEGMMIDLVEVAKHYDLIEDLSILDRMHGRGNHPPVWQLPGKRHDRFARRPTLQIRTGFVENDWPAVYGLLLWLKRVALQAGRNQPIGQSLLRRMQVLAWPLSQPQNWRGCPKDVTAPRSHIASDKLLGLIDLQVGQGRDAVILVPDRPRQTMVRQVIGRAGVGVRVSPADFEGEIPTQPKQLVCRVLLPGIPQAFPANSPILTDLAATLLERLALGTIGETAPGRTWRKQKVRPALTHMDLRNR